MSKDYLNAPPTTIRRDDRAVNDDTWIRDLLNRAAIGYLATVHDGQPFINSNLFFYDEAKHAIYFHTARVGRTRANVDESGEKVCFTVTEMGRLLPASEALEFSVEYSGVVIFGSATVVNGEEEETYCLQAILDKYAPHLHPGRDYRPIMPEELKRTSTFRIEIDSWSGKKKEVADDFPGAFRWEDVVK